MVHNVRHYYAYEGQTKTNSEMKEHYITIIIVHIVYIYMLRKSEVMKTNS